MLPEEAAAALRAGVAEALDSGDVVERTDRLAGPEGETDRRYEGRFTALAEPYRGSEAVLLVAREVTERHSRRREAAESVAGPTDAAVTLDVPETLPIRAGRRVERAFEELIRNAIEHSEAASPHLRIEAERTADGRAVVRFADDGPGIPDDEWAVVTGDVEIGPLRHGTGLGLWLVRWIVDAYGGRLDRVTDGDGTTVSLAFER